MNKVVIIGGGASGLVAAIYASLNNEVIIVEKNDTCGKKLLASGNGRCNYFNEDFSIAHYHSQNKELLASIICSEEKNEVLNFFESIGIIPNIKNGYYYPNTDHADSILSSLVLEAKKRNVNFKTNTEVLDIIRLNDGFKLITNNNDIYCDKVVISCGTSAGIKNRSNIESLIKDFNHTVIKYLPALVQLKAQGKFLKLWAGIRIDANIKLYEDENFIKEERGQLQLVDYGISGICVFNLSSYAAKSLNNNHQVFTIIDFLPDVAVKSIDDFIKWIDDRNKKLFNRTIEELFIGIVNKKLLKVLLTIANLDSDDYWQELNNLQKIELAKSLKAFKLEIIDNNSIDRAQVCSGGIKLDEVDLQTFESKKVKNLYFTGEVLDVDGDCGGYNLAFAWISGKRCGKNL